MRLLRPQTLLRLKLLQRCDKKTVQTFNTPACWYEGKKKGKKNRLMTQIRLGSQEFPDKKKERSFLCMHASLNLHLRMTTLLLFVFVLFLLFFTPFPKNSLALRASVISNNAPNILFHYSQVLSSWTNRAVFDVAFVLCEGGQAASLAAQPLNTDFIFIQITNNKPLGAPFANKRALFLSLFISKMLISTHRACGCFFLSFFFFSSGGMFNSKLIKSLEFPLMIVLF